MNAILGIASLMKRDSATSEQAQRIDMIDRAAKYLLGIINGLLDLSKIEAGKFVLERADLSVDRIVEDVCATLSELARAKGLTLCAQIESTPAGLQGDAVRLQQALINYVSNAIKFTESGTITVRVRRLQEAPHSVLLRFEVEDTGIGITSDALPRLFTAKKRRSLPNRRQPLRQFRGCSASIVTA
jgi:signal transduction histidine kinase